MKMQDLFTEIDEIMYSLGDTTLRHKKDRCIGVIKSLEPTAN